MSIEDFQAENLAAFLHEQKADSPRDDGKKSEGAADHAIMERITSVM